VKKVPGILLTYIQMFSFGVHEAPKDVQSIPGYYTYIWIGRAGIITVLTGGTAPRPAHRVPERLPERLENPLQEHAQVRRPNSHV
jgi:hypothetical protein